MKIDLRLIEAASDLGCNAVTGLYEGHPPLSGPGILSGLTMVFVPAVSTFYISQKLGPLARPSSATSSSPSSRPPITPISVRP